MSRSLAIIMMLATLAGCASPPRAQQLLNQRQLDQLRQQARRPQDAGVVLTENPDGSVWLDHAKRFSGEQRAALTLNTKPLQKARYPIVRVRVNNRVVLALVDTGASLSMIDFWGALRTGVSPFGPDFTTRPILSPGGPAELILGMADEMAIGDIKVARAPLAILNDARGMAGRGWLEGFRTEMVLGNDLLSSFAWVQFDVHREHVVFSRTGPYQPARNRLAGTTPLITRYGVPVMLAMIDGQGPVHIALDTGLDTGLWIPRAMANRLEFTELADTGDVRMGRTVGGRAAFKQVRPRTLDLADMRLTDVPTIVSLIQHGENESPYALLGQVLLDRFVVTIDYGARKIYFEAP